MLHRRGNCRPPAGCFATPHHSDDSKVKVSTQALTTWGTGMNSTRDFWMDPALAGPGLGMDDLAERLEGHITRRACGRISDLHVVCSDGWIIVQGRARTYHAKQLAQEAVLDLT